MSRKIPPPYLAARYGNRQMLPNPTEAPAADSTKPSLPEKVLLDSFDFMFSPISLTAANAWRAVVQQNISNQGRFFIIAEL